MKPKACVFCGKMFVPNSARQNSCGDDHCAPCPDCGAPVKIKTSYASFKKYGPRRCEKCRRKAISKAHREFSDKQKQDIVAKAKKTMVSRYGYDSPQKVPEIRAKTLETVREKYGVDNLSQSPEIQKTIRERSIEKYGVAHYTQNPEVRKHMIDGMVEKYGVDNALKSEEIKQKQKDTVFKKYGVGNVAQADSVKAKTRETCFKKYGVEYAAQVPSIVEKRKKTNKERYGASGFVFSDEYLSTKILEPAKKNEYLKFRHNPKRYIETSFDSKPTLYDISKKTGLGEVQVGQYVIQNSLQDLVSYKKSKFENEIFDYLKSVKPDLTVERNNRAILYPKEIDLYLPDFNVGIECNPACTHNVNSNSFDLSSSGLPKGYHYDKSLLARKAGVCLVQLFKVDWNSHQSAVKSLILNALGLKPKVDASELEISKLSTHEAFEFFNQSHVYGFSKSEECLGLKDDKRNIQFAASFRKHKDGSYEVSRFCSSVDCEVTDGLKALVDKFEEFHNSNLYAFTDISYHPNVSLAGCGFEFLGIRNPEYRWVDLNDTQVIRKSGCTKSKLSKMFDENVEDIKSFLLNKSFVQVFDSGKNLWVHR